MAANISPDNLIMSILINSISTMLSITSTFHFSSGTKRLIALPVDVRNRAIREHRHQVAGAGKHECERVFLLRQISERLVGIAQEMHQSRAEEHSAGELRPDHQKPLVPLQEVRRHTSGEGSDEDEDEAPDLGEDERSRSQIWSFRGRSFRSGVVVGAAMAEDGDREEEEEEEEEEERSGHGGVTEEEIGILEIFRVL
eukprot:TRINITY_DN9550_c0_g2_i4.p1 TRINITY_DN9550_c0_g2~~TRINITY_DN9550_c0_g2_i4.p1  ORF type:complete len:198 (-),score=29.37 TRINITY_DN9550_c0_g2_i4:34-627(-)